MAYNPDIKVEQLFQSIQDNVRPGKKFLTGRDTLTYREIFNKISCLCSLFNDMGLKLEDRILLSLDNDADMAVISLSLFFYGLTAVPINPESTLSEVQYVLEMIQVKGIIADRDRLNAWKQNGLVDNSAITLPVAPRTKKTLLSKLLGKPTTESGNSEEYPGILNKYSKNHFHPTDIPSSHTAIILPTSGTTGASKAVQLSRKNILAQSFTMADQMKIDSDSCILNMLPFYHVDAFPNGILLAFICQASLCRLAAFTNQRIPDILDSIYLYKVSFVILVPTMLSLMLKLGRDLKTAFDTEHFRSFISTGSILPESLWKKFEKTTGQQIVNFYGLTEANNLFFSGPDRETRKVGTIGKPVNCDARIIQPKDDHPDNRSGGELAVRGDTVMTGYVDNPKATAAVLKEGWFYTGDLAVCDKDGFYTITGRKSDVIISGGLNILPDEVNDALLSHPEIIEAVTVGVPDDIWGEKAVSFIITKASALTEMEARIYLREILSEYKNPKHIHSISDIPRGPSGKADKKELLKMLQRDSLPLPDSGAEDLAKRVLDIASNCFSTPMEMLTLDTGYDTCQGWDSMAHLNFVIQLENRFHINLQPTDIVNMDTIAKAVEVVKNRMETDATG